MDSEQLSPKVNKKKKALVLLGIQLVIAVALLLLLRIPAVYETALMYWQKLVAKGTGLLVIFYCVLGVLLLLDFAYLAAPFFPKLFVPVTRFFDKINSASPAAKASFWFVASNIILKGISFITTPIFTRLLGPEDYGITSVFITWEGVISVLATLSLSGGVYNIAMLKHKDDIDRYTSSMLGLTGICLTSVYAVCIGINLLFPKIFEIPTSYLLYMAIQTFTNSVISFWLMRKRFDYDYKKVLRYTISNAILSPLCAIVAILLFPESKAYAKIFGAGISGIVIGLVIMVQFLIRGKKLYHKEYYCFALKFNIPLVPHYLSSILLYSSDKLMIDAMVGAAQTGLYSVAHSISGIISVVTQAINQSLIPTTLKAIKSGNFGHIKKTVNGCLALMSVVCLLVSLFAKEAVMVLADQSFVEATYFVPPLTFSVLVAFISGIVGNVLYYHEKTYYMTIFSVVNAILNIVANYFGIRWFGAVAASYTTLGSNLLTLCLYCWAVKREEPNFSKMFDLKWIFTVFVMYSLVTIYSIFFHDNLYARLGLLVAVLLAVVIFRKKMMQVIRSMKQKDV